MSTNVTDDARTNAVDEVYEQWCQAWLGQPVGKGMKDLWDHDYAGVTYQSEENPEALLSWSEIDAYWDWVPTIVMGIPEFETQSRKIAFSGDVAFVFATIRVVMDIKGVPELWTGDPLRASLVLHEVGGAWKMIHYHESRVLNLQRELGLGSLT
jgi:hypothetical protein